MAVADKLAVPASTNRPTFSSLVKKGPGDAMRRFWEGEDRYRRRDDPLRLLGIGENVAISLKGENPRCIVGNR